MRFQPRNASPSKVTPEKRSGNVNHQKFTKLFTGSLDISSAMPSNFSRRSQHKRQTRLAFDPVEPSSSAIMSPTKVGHEASSCQDKAFDLTSPAQKSDDAENALFPSGKKYAVVVETPEKPKRDGKIPFKPLATPAASSQTQVESKNPSGEFFL